VVVPYLHITAQQDTPPLPHTYIWTRIPLDSCEPNDLKPGGPPNYPSFVLSNPCVYLAPCDVNGDPKPLLQPSFTRSRESPIMVSCDQLLGYLNPLGPQMPYIAPFPLTGPFPFHMSAIAGWLVFDLTGVADVPVARHTSKWVLSPRTVRLPRPLLFAILPGRVYARRRYVLVEI
jgi:hypothetical protein